MRRLAGLAIALAAVVIPLHTTGAQQPPAAPSVVSVDIGGRSVKLLVATGQCALDRKQTVDARVLDLASRAIAGQNEMLLHTAECKNLQDARQGKADFLKEFTQAQIALQFKQTDMKGQEAAAAKEICQSLRTQGDAINKEIAGEIKERVKNLQAGIKVNETKSLGILAEDATACYSGILMNVQTPAGTSRLILGVYSMGVINGRLIFLYRFLAEPEAGSVDRLVDLQKKSMRDHVVANQPTGLSR